MLQTNRDPTIDPKPGDVYVKGKKVRLILTKPVQGGELVIEIVEIPWSARGLDWYRWVTLKSHRQWAKAAKVIHATD